MSSRGEAEETARWELEVAGVKLGFNMATAITGLAVLTVIGGAAVFGALPGFGGFAAQAGVDETFKHLDTTLQALGHKIDAIDAKVDKTASDLNRQIEIKASEISAKASSEARETRAYTIRGNIVGLRSRECEALKAGNYPLATSLEDQVTMLNDDYYGVVGRSYPLMPCPQ